MKNCRTILEEKKKKKSLSSIFQQSVFLMNDFELYMTQIQIEGGGFLQGVTKLNYNFVYLCDLKQNLYQ